jgi:hypothetical protein
VEREEVALLERAVTGPTAPSRASDSRTGSANGS